MTEYARTTAVEKIRAGIERANNGVIAMSLAIMDSDSSDAQLEQARLLQPIFAAVRTTMQHALDEFEENPGDDTTTFLMEDGIALAEAVLGEVR